MELSLKVRLLVMSSGERHSLLVDAATGLPVYSPNLFLTSQIRNAGRSHASVASYASCLVILYRFISERRIDLSERFRQLLFLTDSEIDALRDFCKTNFDLQSTKIRQLQNIPGSRFGPKQRVTKETEYKRLTVAANYLTWLARREVPHLEDESSGLMKMARAIRARRPLSKGRNKGLVDRALNDKELARLLEIIEVDNLENPFQLLVRMRNRLIILMLYELGIRAGEALNIRVEDFDFNCNCLKIIRRAGQLDDTRTLQPLVKTLDRNIPVADWLMAEVHRYIVIERSKITSAKKCPYLFVTYKAGQTKGNAWSIAGYHKMWGALRAADPLLQTITGHRLRHTWNHRYSTLVDNGVYKLSEAEEGATRSVLMGWKQGSGTAALYNHRHIVTKANQASLALQTASMKK